jgi:hypothetical protein
MMLVIIFKCSLQQSLGHFDETCITLLLYIYLIKALVKDRNREPLQKKRVTPGASCLCGYLLYW